MKYRMKLLALCILPLLLSACDRPDAPKSIPRENKVFYRECTLDKKEYIPKKYLGKYQTHQGGWMEDNYDPEKYITYWDCGEHGSLVCTLKEVFRYGKTKTWLCLVDNGLAVRIMGLK